ncbi:MAG: ribonucleoside-triphosphate reductase, adenosylcobalamin-dependent [Clostridiales bacterium]|nr:ribonucleoside-triphosphate reductase, adenosylcobalamin-dependent [Clostridiales bacterium]
MKVRKRNHMIVDYKEETIAGAIRKAMSETLAGVDEPLSYKLASEVTGILTQKGLEIVTVDEIQNLVEDLLMQHRRDAAKEYIIYRYERDKGRKKDAIEGAGREDSSDLPKLRDEFITKYKHLPNPMGPLGSFVYYRTYSRWLPGDLRREYWWETVRRAVEYNCGIVPGTSRREAEELFDNVYNMRQFLSGRTLWSGGTEASLRYPLSNFNCAGMVIDDFASFDELFYLLMVGAGVGVRVTLEDVTRLPSIRGGIQVIHRSYEPVAKDDRNDMTTLDFTKKRSVAEIIVGDSKEGWQDSLNYFFKLHYAKRYRDIDTIYINYNNVRPKGERLKVFGGTASGHESLKTMFIKIKSVFNRGGNEEYRLKPIDCLDIANIIGENVVSGGVRRTAEMVLIDPFDQEAINAKSSLYRRNEEGSWVIDPEISHRQISNNSIFYKSKPSRDELRNMLLAMRKSGEPGFVNCEAASKRRENFNTVNPCGEILLDSKGVCNLTTVNVMGFVREDGTMDTDGLLRAMWLSARAAVRMTCLELELERWDAIQKRDRLLGCSVTGWQDAMNAVKYGVPEQTRLLRTLREAIHAAGTGYAKELGINTPLLMTTVKPEGTLSQLPGVSSGVHFSHSPYYIRRVRISADDPLAKVAVMLDWPICPEVNQTWENAVTYVVEFPVKAPSGRTKSDVSAIEQLEIYKMFMSSYVDHNCSITVHVRDHEWDLVEEWLWNNWDDCIALSFLPYDDSFYELLPYEAISAEEYERRISAMKPFVPSLLKQFESGDDNRELDDDCAAGNCPVR